MKKILMRAGMSPFSNATPQQVLSRNMIGSNMGNMLFPYSISRTLMTKDVTIDTITTSRKFTTKDIRMINQTYDAFIIPLANAFRRSFAKELNNLSDFVERLKIPVVVIGVGTQTETHEDVKDTELNQAVTRFMKAVLKHSALVGVRGEITGAYLTELGFQAERDFTVIGCPSMFLYGKELPKHKVTTLTPDANVCMNSKISLPQNFHNFMERSRQSLPNYTYIPQVIEEIYRMYIGMPYRKGFQKNKPKHFPIAPTHEIYLQDKARSFINVPSWLNYLRKQELSFGSRVHGNIAAILAGIPCIIFVSDARIKELVEYHHIPHRMINEITKQTDIFSVHESMDFTQIYNGHVERFFHYLDFYKKNNLDTIYDDQGNPGHCYFDDQIRQIHFRGGLRPLYALPPEKQVKHLAPFLAHYQKLSRQKVHQQGNRICRSDGTERILKPEEVSSGWISSLLGH